MKEINFFKNYNKFYTKTVSGNFKFGENNT